ncbi:MAG: LysR family transcriptional regulator [Pseudomonadota bacterium]
MHLKELDANLIVVLDALLVDASVTKAASRLGRSPSAVSHALANLREIFDDPLFVRAGQRLVPTSRATSLAPTIHVIVSGMESLLRPATPFDPTAQEREFVLACRGAFELTLIHSLRHNIKELAPNITLNWKPLNGLQSFEDMRLGKTHFLIKEGMPDDDAADFQLKKLRSETYITIAKRNHPLSKSKTSALAFQDTEHIVFSSGGLPIHPFEKHLALHDIKLKEMIVASSAFVGVFIALESDALVTLPETIVNALKRYVPLTTIEQPFPKLVVPNYLIWHKSHDRDECHEWVRGKLIELVSDKS